MSSQPLAQRAPGRRRWLRPLLWGMLALAVVGAIVALSGYWLLIGRYRLPRAHIEAGSLAAAPGTYRVDLEFDGRERYYLLHVPPAAEAGTMPLVVALHGGGSRPETLPALTGLLEIADRERFLVALPAGFEGGWNDGRPDSGVPAAEAGIDDVGFILAVLDDVAARMPVDRHRVFATGISNGAMMSVRLACEAADRFAAIAPVAGTAPADLDARCHPSRPVAVIAFLGTADPLVPFEGGAVQSIFTNRRHGRVASAADFEAFWSRHNGCGSAVPRTVPPNLTRGDGSRASVDTFEGCAPGGDVDVYVIDGGGHTWPGGRQYLSPWLVGDTNRDIDASELIWQFFAAQPPR